MFEVRKLGGPNILEKNYCSRWDIVEVDINLAIDVECTVIKAHLFVPDASIKIVYWHLFFL